MNSEIKHIKAKDKTKVLKIIFYTILLIFGIFAALNGLLFSYGEKVPKAFGPAMTAAGLVLTFGFAFLTVYSICRAVSPADALVISDDGYLDLMTSRKGIFIKWSDVQNVKVFGAGSDRSLGVYLKDPARMIEGFDSRAASEAKANMEDGLPPLIYDIGCTEQSPDELYSLMHPHIGSAGNTHHGRNMKYIDPDEEPDQDGNFTIPKL